MLQDSKAYVDTLIEVHKKFRNITKDVFNSNPEFFAAVDKVCFNLYYLNIIFMNIYVYLFK